MIRSGRRSFIGPGLADILCEHHEHTVGRDNCVSFEGKRLQIPAQTHRCHFIKARVRVHRFTPTGAWLCSTGRASSPSTSPTAPGWRTYAPRRPVPRWHAERPSVRSARLGIRPSQRLGSRATRLDNSLCPDVFALPPFAAARCAPRGCGWRDLAPPMDPIGSESPNRESVPVRGRSARTKRGTASPLPPKPDSSICCQHAPNTGLDTPRSV